MVDIYVHHIRVLEDYTRTYTAVTLTLITQRYALGNSTKNNKIVPKFSELTDTYYNIRYDLFRSSNNIYTGRGSHRQTHPRMKYHLVSILILSKISAH